MKKKVIYRNSHKWDDTNHCIHCGCFREQREHPTNKNWNFYVYFNPITGEETRKYKCTILTNQLLMF
jgi:hypothetical protein